MAELADAHGSGPCEATHGGSNPLDRTNETLKSEWFQRFFIIRTYEFNHHEMHLIVKPAAWSFRIAADIRYRKMNMFCMTAFCEKQVKNEAIRKVYEAHP